MERNALFHLKISENKVHRTSDFYPWPFEGLWTQREKNPKRQKGKYFCKVYFKRLFGSNDRLQLKVKPCTKLLSVFWISEQVFLKRNRIRYADIRAIKESYLFNF